MNCYYGHLNIGDKIDGSGDIDEDGDEYWDFEMFGLTLWKGRF
jgi:hypothetical protein